MNMQCNYLCLQMARDGSHPTLHSYNGNGGGNGSSSSSSSLSAAPVTMNVTESKIQYIRHMVYQYLSCRDAEVRVSVTDPFPPPFRIESR